MVNPQIQEVSLVKQCELLSISRSGWYYAPKGENPLNLKLMRLIDEQFLKTPFYGSRQMMRYLKRQGYCVGRGRIRRLMKLMGIEAIYQKPITSMKHPENKVYPYLLRHLKVNSPNQVWCTDITYIPIKRGFLYLIAVIDWYSKKVLSWRISNTLDTHFCIEALEEALEKYPHPEIFNTDQGSQFTSFEFTTVLKEHGIKISMDGRGCWKDNVFIERLWRSLKYECVYLNAFENGIEARKEIGDWIKFYNMERPHSRFGLKTPSEAYMIYSHIKGVSPTASHL